MSVITFNDARGVEQSVDLERDKFSLAFNADCMDFLRACPDKCIDIAVVDPPFGDGNGDSYFGNVERERERENRDGALQPILQSRRDIREIQAPNTHGGHRSRLLRPVPWWKLLRKVSR